MIRRSDTLCMRPYRALSLVLAAFGVVRAEAQAGLPNLPVVRDRVIDAAADDVESVVRFRVGT